MVLSKKINPQNLPVGGDDLFYSKFLNLILGYVGLYTIQLRLSTQINEEAFLAADPKRYLG